MLEQPALYGLVTVQITASYLLPLLNSDLGLNKNAHFEKTAVKV